MRRPVLLVSLALNLLVAADETQGGPDKAKNIRRNDVYLIRA